MKPIIAFFNFALLAILIFTIAGKGFPADAISWLIFLALFAAPIATFFALWKAHSKSKTLAVALNVGLLVIMIFILAKDGFPMNPNGWLIVFVLLAVPLTTLSVFGQEHNKGGIPPLIQSEHQNFNVQQAKEKFGYAKGQKMPAFLTSVAVVLVLYALGSVFSYAIGVGNIQDFHLPIHLATLFGFVFVAKTAPTRWVVHVALVLVVSFLLAGAYEALWRIAIYGKGYVFGYHLWTLQWWLVAATIGMLLGRTVFKASPRAGESSDRSGR